MTKLVRYAVLAAVLLLALALPAAAQFDFPIVDLNPNDANSITSFSSRSPQLIVNEDYNETYLVPYPSHDGLAIVNAQGGYFDKVVVGNFTHLTFNVENTGPYIWSDYHFEFWDDDFSDRMHPTLTGWGNNYFQNIQYTADGILEFWAPNWQEPGQTNTFDLFFQTPLTDELGIRQVATTPVPPAVWLFGSGLLGLAGWGYRRRKR